MGNRRVRARKSTLHVSIVQTFLQGIQQEAKKRFLLWLESAIARGLELWQSNAL